MINSMRLNLIFFNVTLLLSITAKADLAHRNVPMFQPQRLQLSLEAQSFESSSNFLADGMKDQLPKGFKFVTYDVVLSSMYDLSDEWAISADLGLGYAESFSADFALGNPDSTDVLTYRNNRQFKDIKLGLWRLYDTVHFGRFILDGFYLLNLVDNDLDNDEASVSDGVSWLQAGFWWQPKRHPSTKDKYEKNFAHISAHRAILRTYLGFRSRDGLSDVLIYKIHPQFAYKKFVYGAELNGMFTVIKQDDEARVANAVLNQRYNASIFRYNAWNPNILEGMLWAGYQVRPFSQLRAGVSQVLGQENTAEGFGVFLEWQVSMTVTPSGMFFSDFFGNSNGVNPRRNNMEIKDYGPAPKEKPKAKSTDLQDL